MKPVPVRRFQMGIVKEDSVVECPPLVQGIPRTGPHDVINGVIERFGEFRDPGSSGRGEGREAADRKRALPAAACRKPTTMTDGGQLYGGRHP